MTKCFADGGKDMTIAESCPEKRNFRTFGDSKCIANA